MATQDTSAEMRQRRQLHSLLNSLRHRLRRRQATTADVVRVENRDIGGSGEYKFVPADFNFELGESVTFEMSAETEFHTFTVDDLDIDEEMDAGETITFSYTFDRAGTFEIICIPHQAFGMKGVIVVK